MRSLLLNLDAISGANYQYSINHVEPFQILSSRKECSKRSNVDTMTEKLSVKQKDIKRLSHHSYPFVNSFAILQIFSLLSPHKMSWVVGVRSGTDDFPTVANQSRCIFAKKRFIRHQRWISDIKICETWGWDFSYKLSWRLRRCFVAWSQLKVYKA